MGECRKNVVFISRAGEDRDVAVDVNNILEDAGYVTYFQDKDFGNASFMERMAQGLRHVDSGGIVLALLSPSYLSKEACLKEARYPLQNDMPNSKERLVLLKIAECSPGDLLKDIRYEDLTSWRVEDPRYSSAILSAVERSFNYNNVLAPNSPIGEHKSIERILLYLENEDQGRIGEEWSIGLALLILSVALALFEQCIFLVNTVFNESFEAWIGLGPILFAWLFIPVALYWWSEKMTKSEFE